jgi:hypothetical protein
MRGSTVSVSDGTPQTSNRGDEKTIVVRGAECGDLRTELMSVSPPAVEGDSSMQMKVVPGGWISGDWSVCH